MALSLALDELGNLGFNGTVSLEAHRKTTKKLQTVKLSTLSCIPGIAGVGEETALVLRLVTLTGSLVLPGCQPLPISMSYTLNHASPGSSDFERGDLKQANDVLHKLGTGIFHAAVTGAFGLCFWAFGLSASRFRVESRGVRWLRV